MFIIYKDFERGYLFTVCL